MRERYVGCVASWFRRGVRHCRTEGIRPTVQKLPTGVRWLRDDLRSLGANPDDVQRTWKQREGEYSPEYYAIVGPDRTSESIVETVDERFDPSDRPSILEIGCSSGRHLEALRRAGYEDLSGIEINPRAVKVMEKAYPELASRVDFYVGALEAVIEAIDDDRFDFVFAVETFELVPPVNEWVFEEVARITGDTLVTVASGPERWSDHRPAECHGEYPFFYRAYDSVFEPTGFRTVDRRTVPESSLSMWVFENATGEENIHI